MELKTNIIGYRLSMTPDQPYKVEQSLKVYQGLVAKIMIKLNLAFTQTLNGLNGRSITVAVSNKSLAHFIWRHNNCSSETPGYYNLRMKSLYKTSHFFMFQDYKKHQLCTQEMSRLLKGRALFNGALNFNDFLKIVKEQAPLRGCFYKIKKDEKTVGYLLGTMHVGNPLFLNLNPKINKALQKSQIVAGEQRLDNKSAIQTRPELEGKRRKFNQVLAKSLQQANMSHEHGIEKCLLKKVNSMGNKELVALESLEEAQISLNRIFEDFDMKEKPFGNKLRHIFHHVLKGDEEFAIRTLRDLPARDRENLIQRNINMAQRSEPLFERDRTFIAVGNLHLYGEQGMKTLLEQRGYVLKRV